MLRSLVVASLIWVGLGSAGLAADRLSLLFLGDQGHHQPRPRFEQLAPVLKERGIDLVYTEAMSDLSRETLAKYDGLVLYANIDRIEPDQEQALLDYVASGKGFIPLHCASYCFRNSKACVALMGAQFQKHGTGVFRVTPAIKDHPITTGYGGFESWDETYVHHLHNEKDRTILEFRIEGDQKEPWTWVRNEGRGRVFYTAWGHDDRTWSNPGFHNLVERGIRWAVGDDPARVPAFHDLPEMTPFRTDVAAFEYGSGKLPNYLNTKKWGEQGEVITRMQLPLPPEESAKHYVHPVDFRLELFAAEPQIGKPICMTWDERGRLWIAETVDYPNELQQPGKGRDRIRICEDTNGDGKADKFTVFAENLSIPTSLAISHGGVIVTQAPDTLFLKDTNGDDKADVRRVLFTGWMTNDTHAGPSNLNYGPDGWFYGMVGYAGFEGEIAGEKQSFRTGFFRFHVRAGADGLPVVNGFEFLRNTNNNSWGVGFSEDGILFGSTANGNPSVYLPIPNRYYERVKGWSSSVLGSIADSNKFVPVTDKVRQVDWHGGFTAAAGHALYTARAWPKEYWNRAAFVTEPTGHLIATFILSANGADFRSKNSWNVLASNDEWAAPIMAEVGPDGQLWVIDWYNIIVQHNPTPVGFETGKGNAYVTDLRDKTHGRVYRIVAKDGKPSAQPPRDWEKGDSPSWVKHLASDNLFWRRQAQRLLLEGGSKTVVPQLVKLATDRTLDEAGMAPGAMHAIQTLERLHEVDPGTEGYPAVLAGLTHPAAGVRRAAVQALASTDSHLGDDDEAKRLNAILNANTLADKEPQVVLATLLALADLPVSKAAGEKIAPLFNDSKLVADRWLADALVAAAATHAESVLSMVDLARTDEGAKRLAIVAEHFARSDGRAALASVVRALPKRSPATADAIFGGLLKGWPRDTTAKLNEDDVAALVRLFETAPAATKSQVIAAAKRWQVKALDKYAEQIVEVLLATASDTKTNDAARLSAVSQLMDLQAGSVKSAEALLALVTAKSSPELSQGLLDQVARSTSGETGAVLVDAAVRFTPANKTRAIKVLLTKPDWTLALLSKIEAGGLSVDELALDQKSALASHPDTKIASRAKALLAMSGGLPSPDREKVLAELHSVIEQPGNVAAGREVYVKNCAKCHVHGKEGQRVGPDLTGMAVHPKEELLVHILDPNRSVEGNFRLYTVELADGRVTNGMLASETKTTIELIDAEGKASVLQREDIEEIAASTKSLMPEGFEKQLSRTDFANLLEFLTQKGKYVPLPLAKQATVVTTKGMFYSSDNPTERLVFRDWKPKTVGEVPFVLIDPQGDRVANAIMLNGPQGKLPPTMPKSVTIPAHVEATKIHLLSGISGWGFPAAPAGSVSLIVKLVYADGQTETHELKNGVHFADYIRRVDVPESTFAFDLAGRQVRYLSVTPERKAALKEIELVKGPDTTAPVVMAITVETGNRE